MASLNYIGEEPPARPGGLPWRDQHVEAAEARARKKTWAEVGEIVGYAENTVQKYAQLDGWNDLVMWAQYRALEKRREDWLQKEEHMIFDGIEAMHEALIETMRGTPSKIHTLIIRGGTSVKVDGKVIESDDDIEIETLEAPSPYVRVHAAATYAKIIGYEETKKLLAQRLYGENEKASSPVEQYGAGEYSDAEFIEATMELPDYEEDE